MRPGMYVTAILKLAERKDVLTLPAAAIVTENGKSYCVTVEDGKIARKEIVVGLRAGSEVEIVSGLSGGEAVVALNPGSFTVGQAVEIATPVAPK